jgi:hypothetical protein
MKSILQSITLVVFVALSICACADEKDDRAAEPKKKIYSIYISGGQPGTSVLVTDLVKEEYLGITCIKGIGVENYSKGIPIRIPLQSVTMIMEYESMKDFGDRSEAYYKEYPKFKEEAEQDASGNRR